MGVLSDVYRGQNDYNFPRWWKRVGIVSTVLVIISLGSLFARGLNLSIDFEGGSIWEVPSQDFTEAQAAAALQPFGVNAMERFQEATTTEGGRVIRVSGRVDSVAQGAKAADALAKASGLQQGEVKVNTVGPSWGSDITGQARLSLIVFIVLVAAYIAWRLETRMAAAAIVAVVHDIVITIGVYSVFQIEVTPATVISFLTILGFSLYDTIVVYDRVQENATRLGRSGQYTYTSIMRRSLNQVFMRSVNTTMVTIIPVLSILIVGQFVFGQETLGDFSLALLIGLVSGTYSSLFVAPPLTAWLKEREPRWTQIRERLVAKGVDITDTTWNGAGAGAGAGAVGATVPARPRTARGAATARSGAATSPKAATSPSSSSSASSERDSPSTATVADAASADDEAPASAPAPKNPYGNVPPRPRKTKKR